MNKKDLRWIKVGTTRFIPELKMNGPVVMPLQVPAQDVLSIVNRGYIVDEIHPVTKQQIRLTSTNVFDENRFGKREVAKTPIPESHKAKLEPVVTPVVEVKQPVIEPVTEPEPVSEPEVEPAPEVTVDAEPEVEVVEETVEVEPEVEEQPVVAEAQAPKQNHNKNHKKNHK